MKIGAERNKVIVLACLIGVAGYFFYDNVLSSPEAPAQRRAQAPQTTAPARAASPGNAPRTASGLRRTAGAPRIQEFKPSLVPKKGEEPDLASIDPTLRMDLFQRVQSVEREGGERNLFQFGSAPAPESPKVDAPKIVPKTPQQVAQEQAQQQAQQSGAVKPAPVPIALKFYGYLSQKGEAARRRAFLLDGDDIIVAEEGEVVRKRYKIVRININSVVVEDTQSSNTQTLPLVTPPAGPQGTG